MPHWPKRARPPARARWKDAPAASASTPRYAPKGGVNGWQGRADLVLEGRDMAAISQLAGRLSGMVVSNVAYGLARTTRERVEGDVAAQAIGRFKARADTYAKQFGFGGYAIREVNVEGRRGISARHATGAGHVGQPGFGLGGAGRGGPRRT